MRKRTRARELALRLIFQVDVGDLPLEAVLDAARESVKAAPEDFDYAEQLVRGALADLDALDRTIDEHASGWSVDRLAKVDKNVLRLAVHELLAHPEVPPEVCVNEAVEIASKYSTEASGRFVNGVLGAIVRERRESHSRLEIKAT